METYNIGLMFGGENLLGSNGLDSVLVMVDMLLAAYT